MVVALSIGGFLIEDGLIPICIITPVLEHLLCYVRQPDGIFSLLVVLSSCGIE